jgi:hypothetical protein
MPLPPSWNMRRRAIRSPDASGRAREVKRAGIDVSAKTVGKLLKEMKFSLRINLKSLESGLSKPPDPWQRD